MRPQVAGIDITYTHRYPQRYLQKPIIHEYMYIYTHINYELWIYASIHIHIHIKLYMCRQQINMHIRIRYRCMHTFHSTDLEGCRNSPKCQRSWKLPSRFFASQIGDVQAATLRPKALRSSPTNRGPKDRKNHGQHPKERGSYRIICGILIRGILGFL